MLLHCCTYLAICIKENIPSCILAPPEAVKTITGNHRELPFHTSYIASHNGCTILPIKGCIHNPYICGIPTDKTPASYKSIHKPCLSLSFYQLISITRKLRVIWLLIDDPFPQMYPHPGSSPDVHLQTP